MLVSATPPLPLEPRVGDAVRLTHPHGSVPAGAEGQVVPFDRLVPASHLERIA